MNFTEAEKKATDQDERERTLHNLDQLLQRYEDDPSLPGNVLFWPSPARNALEKVSMILLSHTSTKVRSDGN